ncbi:MAG: GAF domain-containing protein [Aphanothece sp. CMT-3BRIN-NPC111]|jgi:twitching motility protein PilJ|nr:GAF domain-containing protein [Aphanothece sp. CMT-3BRIN-NPC111]
MTKNNSAKPERNYSSASVTPAIAKPTPSAIATRNGNGGNNSRSYTEVEIPSIETTPELRHSRDSKAGGSWLERLSLRTKATLLAIAIGTLPVLAVGATAYYIANKEVTQQIYSIKKDSAVDAADKINRYMRDRYADIQFITTLPAFTNPKTRATLTPQDTQALLNRYVEFYKGYENIALLSADGQGRLIVESGTKFKKGVQKGQLYYQEVLKTDAPVITLERSLSTGKLNVYFAAPVKDTVTGKTFQVMRARLPFTVLEDVLKSYSGGGDNYYLIDPEGKFFLSSDKNAAGKDAKSYFSNFSELLQEKIADAKLAVRLTDNTEEVLAYSPLGSIEGLPQLDWQTIITTDKGVAFAPQRQLLTTLEIGVALVALLVAAIAAYLANRATRPIITAANAVQKIGEGELDTRLAVTGRDEFAALGSNINVMTDQIQVLLAEQAAETRRVQLLADITSRIRQTLKTESILKTVVREILRALKCDRVVVLHFNSVTENDRVVAESVASRYPKLLGSQIDALAFKERYISSDNRSPVTTINNIALEPNLPDTHKQWLAQYKVQAQLTAPIRVQGQVYGLLMVQQCSAARDWLPSEINFLAQLATQVGISLEQANLLEQIETARQQADLMAQDQKQQKEAIQMQLVQLLSDVDAAAQGDLTVRADVTASEIGTVGDFFNAIIQSLRQVVSQVITAAAQVNSAVANTEEGIRELADKALKQAEDISTTLNSVEQMTLSIQAVANSARQAAEVARSAAITANAGGAAMDLTVQSILSLRETVAETGKKVQRLGESSQSISKAVSLIKQIALQTNVLAINASFEAARAGEEGRGFAVVAEEVAKLAARSAAATQEIQGIVENIQLETSEVVEAMELGTIQVVDGTRLVEETKQSLGQIVAVSQQIDELVRSISDATVSQSQTSQIVMNLMNEIAKVSEQTSHSSHQVSGSLQQTVEVARQLQESVDVFKVD